MTSRNLNVGTALIILALVTTACVAPVSAILLDDTTSVVNVQATGALSTKYNVYTMSGMSTVFESGYFERTVASNGESLYMNTVELSAPNVLGEPTAISTDRTFGFNLNQDNVMGSASTRETAMITMYGPYPVSTESFEQQICDSVIVSSDFFAAESIGVATQNNLLTGITPMEIGMTSASIGHNVEAIGTNLGYGTISVNALSMAGIGNTTTLGHIDRFDQRISFSGDFGIESSFTRNLTYRPPPQEFAPVAPLCIFV